MCHEFVLFIVMHACTNLYIPLIKNIYLLYFTNMIFNTFAFYLSYDLVTATWSNEEGASNLLNRKDLPDVVLVRKVKK